MIRAVEQYISQVVHIPERLVDRIGMYRTVTLGLVFLVISSLLASLLGWLAYEPLDLLTSLVIAVIVGLGTNVVCARIWRVSGNHESALITALIVFLLMIPNDSLVLNWPLAAAIALGIVSKYVITYRQQHILNPAAVGMVLVVLGVGVINVVSGADFNTDIFHWWVANPALFWPLVIVGSLVVFKIRRWPMVLACIGVGGVIFMTEWWWLFGTSPFESGQIFLTSFPVLFLAFFMLTEPFTTPPTQGQQVAYGAIVGALASTLQFAQLGFPMTPELALVIGNVFAYTYRIRQKLFLELLEKRQIATDTWEFIFKKPATFSFTAGQYLEWMLPHEQSDSRGPRRYFTIASSPTESVLRLALKVMPENGSSYKQALSNLDTGGVIIASQLAGDFVLPQDTTLKLGMIAGGIGVTPFSSHIRYMQDSGVEFDTHLYYCANTVGELAYLEEFQGAAASLPLHVTPVIAQDDVSDQPTMESGYVTTDILDRRTPDWRERTWYLSGPPGMVNAYYDLLRDAGIPRRQIKKDFFPGLA